MLVITLVLAVAAPKITVLDDGLQTRYRRDKWMTVSAVIENPDLGDLTGTFQARVHAPTYARGRRESMVVVVGSRPLSVPGRSSKKYDLPLLMDRVVPTTFEVVVTLGGKEHAVNVSLQQLRKATSFIVLDETGSSLKYIDVLNDLETVHTTTDSLPDAPVGYEMFRGVIINGGALKGGDLSTLSTTQIDALRTFVANGGSLIVATGRYHASVRGTFVEHLLPVNLGEYTTVSGGDINTYGILAQAQDELRQEMATMTAPMNVVRALPGGEVQEVLSTFKDGGKQYPLAVLGRFGRGHVMFLAFDAGYNSAVDRLIDRELFWKAFLDAIPARELELAWTEQAYLQEVRPPSRLFITTVLLAYVLLIGPVNYLVFARRQKYWRNFLSIPAVAVLFSLLIVFYGIWFRSSSVVAHVLSMDIVTYGLPHHEVLSKLVLFSPSERSYEVGYTGGSTYPVKNFKGFTTDGVVMEDMRLGTWSADLQLVRTFTSHDVVQGGVTLKPVGRNDCVASGTITNLSPYPLQDIYIAAGRRYMASIGDLAPGETADLAALVPECKRFDPYTVLEGMPEDISTEELEEMRELLSNCMSRSSGGLNYRVDGVDVRKHFFDVSVSPSPGSRTDGFMGCVRSFPAEVST